MGSFTVSVSGLRDISSGVFSIDSLFVTSLLPDTLPPLVVRRVPESKKAIPSNGRLELGFGRPIREGAIFVARRDIIAVDSVKSDTSYIPIPGRSSLIDPYTLIFEPESLQSLTGRLNFRLASATGVNNIVHSETLWTEIFPPKEQSNGAITVDVSDGKTGRYFLSDDRGNRIRIIPKSKDSLNTLFSDAVPEG